MQINKTNIITFLTANHWKFVGENDLFVKYKAPPSIDIRDYIIEIPKSTESKGAQQHMVRIVNNLSILYPSLEGIDSQYILIDKKTIMSTRVADNDTQNGTIAFDKLRNLYYYQSRILKQAATFAVSKKQIFGEAKSEVKELLGKSRALQTEKGSYVTKLLLPSDEEFLFDEINIGDISGKVIGSLDFLNKEIYSTELAKIDESFVEQYSDVLNIDLYSEIYNLFWKPKINNIDVSFNSLSQDSFIRMEHMLNEKKRNHFRLFIKKAKGILMKQEPLSAFGYINKLSSSDPKTDSNNYIELVADVANIEQKIKVYLNKEDYHNAVEAHGDRKYVKVSGLADHLKSQYIIRNVEGFDIGPSI